MTTKLLDDDDDDDSTKETDLRDDKNTNASNGIVSVDGEEKKRRWVLH